MENRTLRFKTNLHCSGCMDRVKPVLDQADTIASWNLDLNHPDKILEVQSRGIGAEEVIALLAGRGYQAEEI